MFIDIPRELEPRNFDTHFKYPRDVYITMLMCTAIVMVKSLLVLPVGTFIVDKLDTDKKLGFTKRKKFKVAFWRATFYFSSSLYGYFALKGEVWTRTLKGIRETWGVSQTPHKILFYYYLEFSYYLVETFYLFNEHNYKDFWQMFLHHITTLGLISTSYCRDFLRYGVAIMAIHDIADPFLEICKLINYVYDTSSTTFVFVCFTAVFIVSRLGIYTFLIALPACTMLQRQRFEPVLYSIIPMLYGLVVMHVIWSYMILRMMKRVVMGAKPEDTRSMGSDACDGAGNIHTGKS